MQLSDENRFKLTKSGILDNTTILRFSHATSSGAGTESHIECLNKIMLLRNNMTILYLYMPDELEQVETRYIGRGRLIHIPMEYKMKPAPQHFIPIRKLIYKCSTIIPGYGNYIPYFREAIDISAIINKMFSEYHVNLVVNHFPGSKDSLILMKETAAKKIPILVMNHFHNSWFNKKPIRKQMQYAQMAAGLSNIKMPRYLRSRFVNLSNGIDTDFFKPEVNVDSYNQDNSKPILLLPARIVKNKGHMDFLKILCYLRNNGFECSATFAGRNDSPEYKAQLDQFIREHHLSDHVFFTGTLSPDLMRNLYAKSTLMVLPTYHDEGLPRVILESQSMELPPVCYDSGGVPESIIQDQTGYYVKKGDISNMQKKILNLLTNKSKRLQMGKNGRKFIINNFSLISLAERHELTYFRLIHSTTDNS